MGSNFISGLRPALVMTLLFGILTCGAYPLAVMGIGKLAFARQAEGSLITDTKGVVIGSSLIGQSFTSDGYFNSRPSAAGKGYDGTASSGSNLGPTSKALADRIAGDIKTRRAQGVTGPIPADLVTASGSGLDPDLSPAAALVQVPRIARARHVPEDSLRTLVEQHSQHPLLGFIGEDRVNVLELNRQLDILAGTLNGH
ncbi:K+-transporting ATPase ATPase C chain [Sphingomonas vulcanisoli]|uniref:Potassium-transporting ATPase KdpC subunit n=1 Tax=Sphingomonas vulcanisoli TaxID=1658060 RepID=A0ABX0TSM0_9SPHN|nr:potassium-transporting ATPase subunit KdpC [Sphingomonas vulcanisoli]NIJ08527.1 K+-transporting ATPase ATPase C chain [Sphingomonas vulcanisoli]